MAEVVRDIGHGQPLPYREHGERKISADMRDGQGLTASHSIDADLDDLLGWKGLRVLARADAQPGQPPGTAAVALTHV
jgi:hypothetical protein